VVDEGEWRGLDGVVSEQRALTDFVEEEPEEEKSPEDDVDA